MAIRTELYRHFTKDGDLLYVGISLTTAARLAGHRSASKWFDQIATVTIERFETREQALQAEAAAIIAEKPLFNVVHADGNKHTSLHNDLSKFLLNGGNVAKLMSVTYNKFYYALANGRFPVEPAMISEGRRYWRRRDVLDYILNGGRV